MRHSLANLACLASLSTLAAACGGGGGGGGGGAPPPQIAAPRIALSTTADATFVLNLATVEGSTIPDQVVTVQNAGAGTLLWTASDDVTWLSTSPFSGSDQDTLTISIDVSGLTPNTYTGRVTVSDPLAENGSDFVDVFLTVTEDMSAGLPVLGITQAIRPDFLTGASAPAISLQDQFVHRYQAPAVAGTSYDLSIDTAPSGAPLTVLVRQTSTNGTDLVAEQVVTTPWQDTVTATQDGTLDVYVFDHLQASLMLSSLTVLATNQPYDPTSFDMIVHIVGDPPFIGLLGDPVAGTTIYNDLTTDADCSAFVADLAAAMNTRLALTGVQVRTGTLGFSRISNAQAQAANSTLFDSINGVTRMPGSSNEAAVSALGGLGVPASDPNFGRALDVFVFHSPGVNAALGVCECRPGTISPLLGGTFVGTGPRHHLRTRLFEEGAVGFGPVSLSEIAETMAHELGHFLTLHHPTRSGSPFQDDGFSDTPISLDLNANGQVDSADSRPDEPFVMFLFDTPAVQAQWSTSQGAAMRGYLAIREH